MLYENNILIVFCFFIDESILKCTKSLDLTTPENTIKALFKAMYDGDGTSAAAVFADGCEFKFCLHHKGWRTKRLIRATLHEICRSNRYPA